MFLENYYAALSVETLAAAFSLSVLMSSAIYVQLMNTSKSITFALLFVMSFWFLNCFYCFKYSLHTICLLVYVFAAEQKYASFLLKMKIKGKLGVRLCFKLIRVHGVIRVIKRALGVIVRRRFGV